MATKRHIIHIKLSTIKKDELITLFSAPRIDSQQLTPKDVVYVLDELDIDIDKMMFKLARQNEQCIMAKNTIEKLVSASISDQVQNQNKQQSSVVIVGNDEKKQQAQALGETQVKATLDTVNNLEKIIDSITKAYDKITSMETDLVTLTDLLTVFQGSVPIDGCIIIAMTNEFEKLKNSCPAMFRAGRLTPVYFGNFDLKMLSEVVNKYFGKTFTFGKNMPIMLPPSEIMEMITPAKIQHLTYEVFIELLKTRIQGINSE
jgi:SpoVK/Ycf46/Vps4 family AAA+-type ATPase